MNLLQKGSFSWFISFYSFIHNGMICRIMNIAFITKDYGGRRGNGIKKCDPFESHRIKVLCKSLLHRSRQEGSVAEDVENIFGCRNEEGLALLDMNAVDMCFPPQANDHHKGIRM